MEEAFHKLRNAKGGGGSFGGLRASFLGSGLPLGPSRGSFWEALGVTLGSFGGLLESLLAPLGVIVDTFGVKRLN